MFGGDSGVCTPRTFKTKSTNLGGIKQRLEQAWLDSGRGGKQEGGSEGVTFCLNRN